MEQLGQTETLVNLVPLGMMVPREAQDLWDPRDHPDPKEMEEWRVFQEIRGSQETLGKMVLLVYPERREMMDFPVLLVTKEILGLLVPQAHGVILEEEKVRCLFQYLKMNIFFFRQLKSRVVTGDSV